MKKKSKPKSDLKIKSADGQANGFPNILTMSLGERERQYRQSEDVFFLVYQFSSWLETLPKGGVGGATNLLRMFLREKGYVKED